MQCSCYKMHPVYLTPRREAQFIRLIKSPHKTPVSHNVAIWTFLVSIKPVDQNFAMMWKRWQKYYIRSKDLRGFWFCNISDYTFASLQILRILFQIIISWSARLVSCTRPKVVREWRASTGGVDAEHTFLVVASNQTDHHWKGMVSPCAISALLLNYWSMQAFIQPNVTTWIE